MLTIIRATIKIALMMVNTQKLWLIFQTVASFHLSLNLLFFSYFVSVFLSVCLFTTYLSTLYLKSCKTNFQVLQYFSTIFHICVKIWCMVVGLWVIPLHKVLQFLFFQINLYHCILHNKFNKKWPKTKYLMWLA